MTFHINAGCGFESRSKYLFGKASLQLKLVEGDSAGIVTAFYVSIFCNPIQVIWCTVRSPLITLEN